MTYLELFPEREREKIYQPIMSILSSKEIKAEKTLVAVYTLTERDSCLRSSDRSGETISPQEDESVKWPLLTKSEKGLNQESFNS